MVEFKKIQCPFCKTVSIQSIFHPSYIKAVTSRVSAGAKTKFRKTEEKYEIVSGCQKCGKTKKEVETAFKEGTPEDKERRKERIEELNRLREELRRERESKV